MQQHSFAFQMSLEPKRKTCTHFRYGWNWSGSHAQGLGEPFLKIGVGKLKKGHTGHGTGAHGLPRCERVNLLVFDDNDTIVVWDSYGHTVRCSWNQWKSIDAIWRVWTIHWWWIFGKKIWCCPCLPNKDNQTWSAEVILLAHDFQRLLLNRYPPGN